MFDAKAEEGRSAVGRSKDGSLRRWWKTTGRAHPEDSAGGGSKHAQAKNAAEEPKAHNGDYKRSMS